MKTLNCYEWYQYCLFYAHLLVFAHPRSLIKLWKNEKKSYIAISVHCTVSDPLEHIIFASWYVEKVHGTGSALT